MSEPIVTIAIATWNTRDLTAKCLTSIQNYCQDLAHEVVVVDNASDDGTSDFILREFPWVHLVQNRRNAGYAQANNQAFRLARGRYILLLNSDTELLDGSLQGMIRYLDTHADVGVIGSALSDSCGTFQQSCYAFPSVKAEILNALFLGHLLPFTPWLGNYNKWDHASEQDVPWIISTALLVRHDVLNTAGMLDDSLFVYGVETEWQYRVRRAGWRIVHVPNAPVLHHGGQSYAQVRHRILRDMIEGGAHTVQHRGRAYFLLYKAVTFLCSCWRLGVLSPLARWGSPGLRIQASREVRFRQAHVAIEVERARGSMVKLRQQLSLVKRTRL